jgi:hypothetical protein
MVGVRLREQAEEMADEGDARALQRRLVLVQPYRDRDQVAQQQEQARGQHGGQGEPIRGETCDSVEGLHVRGHCIGSCRKASRRG